MSLVKRALNAYGKTRADEYARAAADLADRFRASDISLIPRSFGSATRPAEIAFYLDGDERVLAELDGVLFSLSGDKLCVVLDGGSLAEAATLADLGSVIAEKGAAALAALPDNAVRLPTPISWTD